MGKKSVPIDCFWVWPFAQSQSALWLPPSSPNNHQYCHNKHRRKLQHQQIWRSIQFANNGTHRIGVGISVHQCNNIIARAQTGKLHLLSATLKIIHRKIAFHFGQLTRAFQPLLLQEHDLFNVDETQFVIHLKTIHSLAKKVIVIWSKRTQWVGRGDDDDSVV